MTREEVKALPIVNNESASRFEFLLKDGLGFVEYEKRGNKFILMHTEIPDAFKGQGIASIMVTKIMDYLSANDFRMKPFCPYITNFLKKHSEYEDLNR